MRNKLNSLIDNIRASYWFIPMLMLILALILSVVVVSIDSSLEENLAWVTRLVYVQSAEAARSILSTIASSMITVAGLVFSLTMVVLSLSSQQYGSLVLRNYMRDRGNQIVLGTFIATFIYCVLVLRTTQDIEDTTFVPQVSVLVGIGLAIASLAVLVYFIHHVSNSIQAPTIIMRVSDDLIEAIGHLFPHALGQAPPEDTAVNVEALRPGDHFPVRLIYPVQVGYLQLIDEEALIETLNDADVTMELKHRPGHFLLKENTLATVWPVERVDDELVERINDAFLIGERRTQVQDVEFLIDQLASIAVRALSPSLNDPYTAVRCIDRLGEAICYVSHRDIPSRFRFDEAGVLRVIANRMTFEDIVCASFDEIRHYGSSDLKVTRHLLYTLQSIATCVSSTQHKDTLRRYAQLVYEEADAQMRLEVDRQALQQQYAEAVRAAGEIT